MGCQILQETVWALARRQHGVLTRAQLLELGFGREAINHRLRKGKLHPAGWGVYALGRPELTECGRWMAAVLRCGQGAALSHHDAAALWGIRPRVRGPIHVAIPGARMVRRPGLVVHRREHTEMARRVSIPVTTPAHTLVDLATCLDAPALERAVNEADRLGLIDPEALRGELERMGGRRGVAALRGLLDRATFRLTDSELERRFLPIARSAGLPQPETGARVDGFKVDFYWPELGLVVETDGLKYHRTPAQQGRDRLRDQVHTAAGRTALRFTHAQVVFERGHVQSTLAAVARRVR